MPGRGKYPFDVRSSTFRHLGLVGVVGATAELDVGALLLPPAEKGWTWWNSSRWPSAPRLPTDERVPPSSRVHTVSLTGAGVRRERDSALVAGCGCGRGPRSRREALPLERLEQ